MYPSRLLQVSAIALAYGSCKSEMTQLAMRPWLPVGLYLRAPIVAPGGKKTPVTNK